MRDVRKEAEERKQWERGKGGGPQGIRKEDKAGNLDRRSIHRAGRIHS